MMQAQQVRDPQPAFVAEAIPARALAGVRTRRMLAFVIDYAAIGLLWTLALVPVFILGVATLGLGFALYPFLGGAIALAYVGLTMGGRAQATPGMALAGVHLARLDGGTIDPWFAIGHSLVFWTIHVLGTPILLLVALFSPRKQTLHDMALGTVVVRDRVR